MFYALKISTIVVAMAFFSSCEKKYFVASEEEIIDVSFANDMQPFFDAKCIECHNGTGTPLNLTSPGSYDALQGSSIGGIEYVDTDNPEASLLFIKINPPGSMAEHANPKDREMTLVWIVEGAKEN